MKNAQQSRRDREYEVKFTVFGTVSDRDVELNSEHYGYEQDGDGDRHGGADADRKVTVFDVARLAVPMILDGGGLELVHVDVTDEDGVTWPLDVSLEDDGEWVCGTCDAPPSPPSKPPQR